MSMFDKLEYGYIQYIVHLSLNSWISLSITTHILSLSSSLKNATSSTSSSTLFFLEGRRLKLSTNYSIRYHIMLEYLHLDIVIMIFSLSLACLFTSLFGGLSSGVKNFLMFFSLKIFPDFVFS